MADIYQTDSTRLMKLTELDEGAKDLCRPEELGGIWQHQLDAPLQFDLTSRIEEPSTTFAAAVATTSRPPGTFRELLQHQQPPIEFLKLSKDFAKTHAHGTGGALPHGIALTLYYAAIAAALVRCRERITSLGDTELHKGFKWVIAQPWLDDSTRKLSEEALKALPP